MMLFKNRYDRKQAMYPVYSPVPSRPEPDKHR